MSDVEVFQLKKDNHIVTFRLEKWTGLRGLEKQTIEVGVGFVGENHMFDSWPMDQARNMWGSKVKEGYRRFPCPKD